MWNYRVIKSVEEKTGDEWFEIHEVYYDQLGKPMGYTSATVGSESLDEIKEVFKMMEIALSKLVLSNKDFNV